jgi:hypothetical protein
MQQIPLTRGQVALVDDDDCEWLSEFNWCAQWEPRSQSFYGVRAAASRSGQPRRKVYIHRAIWEHHHGPISGGFTVDHADRCSLNNWRANLRLATQSQQNQNQRLLSKKNSTGYRGVHRRGQSGNWQAQIQIAGQQVTLGSFDDPVKAARAYDVAALQRDPDFAQLNFP